MKNVLIALIFGFLSSSLFAQQVYINVNEDSVPLKSFKTVPKDNIQPGMIGVYEYTDIASCFCPGVQFDSRTGGSSGDWNRCEPKSVPIFITFGKAESVRPGRVVKSNKKVIMKDCYSIRYDASCKELVTASLDRMARAVDEGISQVFKKRGGPSGAAKKVQCTEEQMDGLDTSYLWKALVP